MKPVSEVDAAALPALGTATGVAETAPPARRWDPRIYQIATLSGLLGYGVLWLDLEVQAWTAVAIIVTALRTQLARPRLTGRGRFDPRGALADVTLAFLACWASLLAARSLWLGEPLAIPLHRLENGALVLFAFFMISDPKTTPDSRAGRLLFAALVALGAYHVQFRLFQTNGLLWSLAVCSLLVPLIDWLLPGRRYQWRTPS